MKKIAQNLLKAIRHNPFVAIAFIIIVLLALFLFGCEPRATSPTDNKTKITRSELQIEINAFLQKAEVAEKSIATHEALRKLLLQSGFTLAAGGALNYYSIATSVLSILGIGSILDNKRKDTIIKLKKAELSNVKNSD